MSSVSPQLEAIGVMLIFPFIVTVRWWRWLVWFRRRSGLTEGPSYPWGLWPGGAWALARCEPLSRLWFLFCHLLASHYWMRAGNMVLVCGQLLDERGGSANDHPH